MNEEKLYSYKRRLPHWRMPGSVYFVTWRIHPIQPDLLPAERAIIASALGHFDGKRYNLLAYVIMSNHIHLLVEPLEDYKLHDILHSWKSFTAHTLQRQFGRKGCIWLDEYYDRIIRDEEEFLEKAQYILNNPLKVWPEIEDYEWVMVKGVKEAGTEARPTSSEACPGNK
jgi:putative transposase